MVLLEAVYVYWRRWTPRAVHCLCLALSSLILLRNPDIMVPQARYFGLATLGRSCWDAILISLRVSFVPLALSAVLGRRIEPFVESQCERLSHPGHFTA